MTPSFIPPSTPNWARNNTPGSSGSPITPGKGVAPVNPLQGSPIHIVQLYEKNLFHKAIAAQKDAHTAAAAATTMALTSLQSMADGLWKLAVASQKTRAANLKKESKRKEEEIKEDDLQRAFERSHYKSKEEFEAYLDKEASKSEFKKQFESPEALNASLLEKLMKPLLDGELVFLEASKKIQEAVSEIKAAVGQRPLHIPAVVAQASQLTHAIMGHLEQQSYFEELKKNNLEDYFKGFLLSGLAQNMGFTDGYLIALCAQNELLQTQIDSILENHNPAQALGASNLTSGGVLEYFKKIANSKEGLSKKTGLKANEISSSQTV